MTKEELNKLKYVLSSVCDSLSHYIGWNDGGYEAFDIIEKELNNKNND